MVLFKFLGAFCAYLYPAYSAYKVLSKRPTDDVQLERWTMYWAVLGILLTLEQIFFLVTYLPFYSLFRTLFLLYLVLPQIQGSTYIYKVHLHPFLLQYEDDIDRSLDRAKDRLWAEGKKWAAVAWEKIAVSAGASPQTRAAMAGADSRGYDAAPLHDVQPPAHAVGVAPPPTLLAPLAGSAQMIGNLWKTYGPTLIATGASFVERQQATSAGGVATAMNPAERKRQLEAELATLSGTGSTSTGLSSSSNTANVRQRTVSGMSGSGSGSSGDEKEKRYEEISKEEVPSNPQPPTPGRSTSWFGGWGSPPSKGYERVKSE